ncbi:hypothetical protein [Aquimarina sp. Aq107]|uniref:hypothetical protein n=1 Tax=Aquimarina sp. Aq107 TaxID=1191912 RepID=UPI000D55E68E|nr:hypothetical protein [Aquimarina sp. Aq107]
MNHFCDCIIRRKNRFTLNICRVLVIFYWKKSVGSLIGLYILGALTGNDATTGEFNGNDIAA